MMEGIIDNLKVIKTRAFKNDLKLCSDGEGHIHQSADPASLFVKNYKKAVQDGTILRYVWYRQISNNTSYKSFDDHINMRRKEEADRLNERYYGKEKYLHITQCM